jgi:hypothetical protein
MQYGVRLWQPFLAPKGVAARPGAQAASATDHCVANNLLSIVWLKQLPEEKNNRRVTTQR